MKKSCAGNLNELMSKEYLENLRNSCNSAIDIVENTMLPAVNTISNMMSSKKKNKPLKSIRGDLSEFKIPDEQWTQEIVSNETDNIFDQTVLYYETGNIRFKDFRINNHYLMPEDFYARRFDNEINRFNNILVGLIPLVEEIRRIEKKPYLIFGLSYWGCNESFRLLSLDDNNRFDNKISIAILGPKYEVKWNTLI